MPNFIQSPVGQQPCALYTPYVPDARHVRSGIAAKNGNPVEGTVGRRRAKRVSHPLLMDFAPRQLNQMQRLFKRATRLGHESGQTSTQTRLETNTEPSTETSTEPSTEPNAKLSTEIRTGARVRRRIQSGRANTEQIRLASSTPFAAIPVSDPTAPAHVFTPVPASVSALAPASVPASVPAPAPEAVIMPTVLLHRPRSGVPVWSTHHRFDVSHGGLSKPELDAQLERITARYLKPTFELMRAIVNGMLLQQNLLIISKGFRDAAVRMHTPTRHTVGRSGVLRETLAELNATLANKTRMTSITLMILQTMRNQANTASEALTLDAALQSLTALRRAQLQSKAAIDLGYAEVTATVHARDKPVIERCPSGPSGEGATPKSYLNVSALTEDCAAKDADSDVLPEHGVENTTDVMADLTTQLTSEDLTHIGSTLQTECTHDLAQASEASVRRAKPVQFASIDGVPLLWSSDANNTWAWRALPTQMYAELIAVPVHSPTYFTLDGQAYIQMFGCTFAVAALWDETLWAIGPPGEPLPPLPLVRAAASNTSNNVTDNVTDNVGDNPRANASVNATEHTTNHLWEFAAPQEDETSLPAWFSPSDDGFIRWKNKKFICYHERLREVAPATIEGEERIRTLAIAVLARLGAPDRRGILHAADGRRLIEGEYGYYPLLEGSDRLGRHNHIYRIASHGLASTAEVSFDAYKRRWYVFGADINKLWFADVFLPSSGTLGVHRRRNLDLIFRLRAAQQALIDAPFLEQRSNLRLALRSTFTGLIQNILRFDNSPATWSDIEQARLSAVWSSLTSLVPTDPQWEQSSLLEQQRLLAENVALFFELAPDFPLNGVAHQVQMTALGMDALQDLQHDHTVLQLNWQFSSNETQGPSAWDALLYMDSPELLPTLLQMMQDREADDIKDAALTVANATRASVDLSADDASAPVRPLATDEPWAQGSSVGEVQQMQVVTETPAASRASFAAWLYEHRMNAALIHFSTWKGLCSFQNASSADEVADMIDLFFLDTPAPRNTPYTVLPRQPVRTGYV